MSWQKVAKCAAKDYPALKADLVELKQARITQKYELRYARHGDTRRATEGAALRELPAAKGWIVKAVDTTLYFARSWDDSEDRLKLAELMYFRPYGQRLKLEAAAKQLGISAGCAREWDRLFLETIACYLEEFSGGAWKMNDD